MARMRLFVAVLLLAATATSAQTWKDLFAYPWTSAPMEIMMGIACPNATICYFTGSTGSAPFAVYYTTDNFKTVTQTHMAGEGMLLMSMAYSTDVNLVAAGLGLLKDSALLYTKDGKTFYDSTEEAMTAGQDVERIGPGEFGFIGSTYSLHSGKGVLYTNDQGDTWKAMDWATSLDIPSYATPRYGGFPTSNTWYVSGGSWPGTSSLLLKDEHQLTRTLAINKRTKKFRRIAAPLSTNEGASSSSQDGYYGVLTKTTDGGSTWTKQYESYNKFYFNDVCCFSATVCMAVAEGFADGESPAARIFGTTDGNTWKELFNTTAPNAGMMMCHMVSATEAWTAGNVAKSQLNNEVVLYHTTDGGKTWTSNSVEKGLGIVIGWSWISGTKAFATALTELSDSTILELS